MSFILYYKFNRSITKLKSIVIEGKETDQERRKKKYTDQKERKEKDEWWRNRRGSNPRPPA